MAALAEERRLEGLSDALVLELASTEQRILVTRNSRHFAPLARQWAEAGRLHAGIILIWSLRHDQFAGIVAAVEACLHQRSKEGEWEGLVVGV